MKEIIIFGRGGQGAVTTAQLLAIAGFETGKQTQSFPNFGVERRGAPVLAFARISDEEIKTRSHVYSMDYGLILDSSLVNYIDMKKYLKENTLIIINSNKSPEEFIDKIGTNNIRTFDVTSKAYEIFNKPIVNTGILGAFSKITNLITLESIYKALDQRFNKKISDLNKVLVKKVYEEA